MILVIVAAAIAAPVAAAGTDTGIGIPAGRDVVYPAHQIISENGRGQNVQVPSRSLGTLRGVGGVGNVAGNPEFAPHTGPYSPSPASVPASVVSSPDAFNWANAGIGVGAGVGLMLLLASAAVYSTRRQRALAAR
ncbi:MAG: hypothetical protein WBB74_03300 [Gaiellaceae bacterium]